MQNATVPALVAASTTRSNIRARMPAKIIHKPPAIIMIAVPKSGCLAINSAGQK